MSSSLGFKVFEDMVVIEVLMVGDIVDVVVESNTFLAVVFSLNSSILDVPLSLLWPSRFDIGIDKDRETAITATKSTVRKITTIFLVLLMVASVNMLWLSETICYVQPTTYENIRTPKKTFRKTAAV